MRFIYTLTAAVAAFALGATTAAQAADYDLDVSHSQIGFKVKHLAISKVSGRFDAFSGSLSYEEGKPESLKGSATIDAKTINTNDKKRDDHLRNEDFFDVEKHPNLSYVIESVNSHGDHLDIVGKLTLLGTTKTVRLHGSVAGPVQDPWGNTRIALSAQGAIMRRDFGMNYGKDVMIGNKVELSIELEAIKKK